MDSFRIVGSERPMDMQEEMFSRELKWDLSLGED